MSWNNHPYYCSISIKLSSSSFFGGIFDAQSLSPLPPPACGLSGGDNLSFPLLSPRKPIIYFLSLWTCRFWMLYTNGIIQYVVLYNWLLSFSCFGFFDPPPPLPQIRSFQAHHQASGSSVPTLQRRLTVIPPEVVLRKSCFCLWVHGKTLPCNTTNDCHSAL